MGANSNLSKAFKSLFLILRSVSISRKLLYLFTVCPFTDNLCYFDARCLRAALYQHSTCLDYAPYDTRYIFANKASLKEYTIIFNSRLLYNYAAFFYVKENIIINICVTPTHATRSKLKLKNN